MRKWVQAIFIMAFILFLINLSTIKTCKPNEYFHNVAVLSLYGTYRESLSTEEQTFYDFIGSAVYAKAFGKDGYLITNTRFPNEDDTCTLMRKWLYDHPRFGPAWYRPYLSIQDKTDIQAIFRSLDGPIPDTWYEDTLNQIQTDDDTMTAIEAFLFLSENYTYDKDLLFEHSHDDYGLITNGAACCQGFAFTYKRLMDTAGIPCVVLTGDTKDGQYHMINAVKLNDKWVAIDVTSALAEQGRDGKLAYFAMDVSTLATVCATPICMPVKELPSHILDTVTDTDGRWIWDSYYGN